LKTASATLTKYLAVLALGWCSWRRCRPRLGLAHRLDQPERIYNESKLAKLAEEKLKEEFKSREKAMADMAGRLKAASKSWKRMRRP
jgi:outer membrane protein